MTATYGVWKCGEKWIAVEEGYLREEYGGDPTTLIPVIPKADMSAPTREGTVTMTGRVDFLPPMLDLDGC